MGVMKACHVEPDGLEADLVSKVNSVEAQQVSNGRETGPSLGGAKVRVLANLRWRQQWPVTGGISNVPKRHL